MREVPVENIALGRFDQAGNQVEDGVQMLLAGLRRRFGPMTGMTAISTIALPVSHALPLALACPIPLLVHFPDTAQT